LQDISIYHRVGDYLLELVRDALQSDAGGRRAREKREESFCHTCVSILKSCAPYHQKLKKAAPTFSTPTPVVAN